MKEGRIIFTKFIDPSAPQQRPDRTICPLRLPINIFTIKIMNQNYSEITVLRFN